MANPHASNELKILRVYDAPLKAVWDAWTDPAQVAKWWGPRGFTLTTHSKDLRTGGIWHYTMHGPDGTDYPNKTLYLEVDPMARLVYDHGGNDERAPLFRVTVLFKERGGKTEMDMTMTLPTPEAAAETRKFIKQAGGDSTWDRLAEYLGHTLAGKEQFVINRSFDAPIETVFEMWTNPDHFKSWMGPTGSTMEFIRADIRPGGASVYKMSFPGGLTMYGRASYLEVRRPDRIVYTQQFVDEHENLARHPMSPTWPATMLTTVELVREGDHRTRINLKWEVYGEATQAELQTFVAARGGMTQGWTGSFDKLEAALAR